LTTPQPYAKPDDVRNAEWILWAWIVWTCVFGIIQTWLNIPAIEQALNDQLQGMISIAPGSMMKMTVAGYGFLAIVSGWFVVKLGQGRQWARSSVLWSYVLQAALLVAPPYPAPVEYLGDVPDLGLQSVAVYLLYRQSSHVWFEKR
jgi:hypothetical protein